MCLGVGSTAGAVQDARAWPSTGFRPPCGLGPEKLSITILRTFGLMNCENLVIEAGHILNVMLIALYPQKLLLYIYMLQVDSGTIFFLKIGLSLFLAIT